MFAQQQLESGSTRQYIEAKTFRRASQCTSGRLQTCMDRRTCALPVCKKEEDGLTCPVTPSKNASVYTGYVCHIVVHLCAIKERRVLSSSVDRSAYWYLGRSLRDHLLARSSSHPSQCQCVKCPGIAMTVAIPESPPVEVCHQSTLPSFEN